jgi:hypothetical protein
MYKIDHKSGLLPYDIDTGHEAAPLMPNQDYQWL